MLYLSVKNGLIRGDVGMARAGPLHLPTVPREDAKYETIDDQKKVILLSGTPPRPAALSASSVSSFCGAVVTEDRDIEVLNRGVSLLHDNASRPHTTHVIRDMFASFGWDIVTLPPYSPDLAPSDFVLFTKLKEFLGGSRFGANKKEMKERKRNSISSGFLESSKEPETVRAGRGSYRTTTRASLALSRFTAKCETTTRNMCRMDMCRMDMCRMDMCRMDMCRMDMCRIVMCRMDMCRMDMCRMDMCRIVMCRMDMCRMDMCRMDMCRIVMCRMDMCRMDMCRMDMCRISNRIACF
ncbi:hypothetical protein AAG570_010035 [Ranatra chinensis]|uniref:Histone-lysine N-methyltransferase SETMAR n=1 Tax=Ranatra chinensis TaxID=642074 RepID=A0ABD0YLH9_9HEMI